MVGFGTKIPQICHSAPVEANSVKVNPNTFAAGIQTFCLDLGGQASLSAAPGYQVFEPRHHFLVPKSFGVANAAGLNLCQPTLKRLTRDAHNVRVLLNQLWRNHFQLLGLEGD